jgi:hypothetical protein
MSQSIEDLVTRMRELEKIAIDPKSDSLARDRATNERLNLVLKLQKGV